MSDLFDKSNVFYYGGMIEEVQLFFLSEIFISLSQYCLIWIKTKRFSNFVRVTYETGKSQREEKQKRLILGQFSFIFKFLKLLEI